MPRTPALAIIVALSVLALPTVATGQPPDPAACGGQSPTIVGTEDADELVGTAGADVIAGLGGDDRILGLGGDDLICGGPGRDELIGGPGNDTVDGGPGSDTLKGQAGADTIRGGGGGDELFGGRGNDQLIGGRGSDELAGQQGHDELLGGGGADSLRGQRGRDQLDGGRRNDQLLGGSGNDTLEGRGGADHLDGGRGNDTLDGGPGKDSCIGGQGLTNDTSCLRGLRLVGIAHLEGRAGLVTAPAGDDRLFIVEQHRGIRLYKDGELLTEPFLDIRRLVARGNEQGVLGLAFHPEYADNGRFFVNYTARSGNTRVVEYTARANDPDRALKRSARLIIEIEQPHHWHNAGMIEFGPDGLLYIATGDGGPGGDPNNSGQDTTTLLGGILRIDVDPDGDEPYAVPDDNPFVGRRGANELWAYGLRNPWRFAIDAPSDRIYIADVGQFNRDEINVAPLSDGGLNYGWKIMEGAICFSPPSGCDRSGLELPTLDVPHNNGICSVIGGYVYRGERIPEIDGHYLWGDLCTGDLNTFLFSKGRATQQTSWLSVDPGAGARSGPTGIHDDGPELGLITSFGRDADGELYVATLGGLVFRIEPIR